MSVTEIARATWHAYRTKGWLKPFRNATPLLAGRAGQGVLSLVAVALATRTLGAELFGVLVLLTSFRQIVTGLTKLRARDTIVRFGAMALQEGDMARLRRIIRFGIAVDAASALLAVTAILVFANVFVEQMDLAPAYLALAKVFGVSAAFALLANTPDGLLRLFDRFDIISVQSVLAPAVQVIGASVLYLAGADLVAFVAVWFLAIAVSRLWLIVMALRELRRQNIGAPGLPTWRDVRRPEAGIWHFTTGTYFVDVLGESKRHGSVLLIGAMLDPAAAAVLRIARQIGTLPSRPLTKVLIPAIFPEFARLTAVNSRKKRRKMATRSGLIAGGIAATATIALIAFGRDLLALIFTADFADAYVPMLLFAAGGVLTALLHPVRPMLAAAGKVFVTATSRCVNIVVWAAAFWFFVPSLGATGAALAELIAIPFSFGTIVILTWPLIRREATMRLDKSSQDSTNMR